MHYQGPAIIIGSIDGRKRQYEIEYNGKRYKNQHADTRADHAHD